MRMKIALPDRPSERCDESESTALRGRGSDLACCRPPRVADEHQAAVLADGATRVRALADADIPDRGK